MTTFGYSIPVDLTIEILLKLPARTVLRFKLVSKSWCSIINSQQFINAFMSLSLSRPRLVLTFNSYNNDRLLFFSSPYQICSFSSSSSSMLVAKKYSLTMPKVAWFTDYTKNSVRGFVCCYLRDRHVVCNPTTGQVIHLEDHNFRGRMYLGYDPNSDKYKVLRIKSPGLCFEYSVRTLGSSDSWRSIKSSIHHSDCGFKNGVCIDGVVYYECKKSHSIRFTICSFDVGSEVLGLIQTPEFFLGQLTNYMGKLAVYRPVRNGFDLSVLDDVKNQLWSKKTYVFPIQSKLSDTSENPYVFKGITTYGECIYVPFFLTWSSEILCYDVENKVERRVEVEGLSGINKSVPCSLLCSYANNIIYL